MDPDRGIEAIFKEAGIALPPLRYSKRRTA
jgi:hypothetical protein